MRWPFAASPKALLIGIIVWAIIIGGFFYLMSQGDGEPQQCIVHVYGDDPCVPTPER